MSYILSVLTCVKVAFALAFCDDLVSAGGCNRVDNMHPDTLAQTFYLRPITMDCSPLQNSVVR